MTTQQKGTHEPYENPKNLQILNRIVNAARADDRIVSIVSYGSYTRDYFDRFSDIEFYFFIKDAYAPEFNDEEWVREVAPMWFYFTNSFGVKTAVFSEFFVRGEFHFHPESEINILDSWKGLVIPGEIERTVLVDKSGAFRRKIEEFCKTTLAIDREAAFKQNFCELANGIIMEWGVLNRRDLFRASTLHSMNLNYLARLLSIVHGQTDHLYSPRLLESFLNSEEYESFSGCFAGLDFDSLRTSLQKMAFFSSAIVQEIGDRDLAGARRAIVERVIERSYRLEGVVSDGMNVLFIKHARKDGRPDEWTLPGGGKLAGETDEEAVKREILEETRLNIEPERMIEEIELPGNILYSSARMFHFVYDGSSEPSPGSEPEDVDENHYTISEVKWIDLSDLSLIDDEYKRFPDMTERLEVIRSYLISLES